MSTPSSSREIAERQERLSSPDELAPSTGRVGYVAESADVATITMRFATETAEKSEPTAFERQREIIYLMTEAKATPQELTDIGHALMNSPRLRDPQEWKRQLERLRRFRNSSIT
jgi:hypothetical protein